MNTLVKADYNTEKIKSFLSDNKLNKNIKKSTHESLIKKIHKIGNKTYNHKVKI